MDHPIRVVLADDHSIVRQGLHSILDPDPRFTVVGSAACGEEALQQVTELQPDVITLDLQMPGLCGPELCQRIHDASPETVILILTAFLDQDLVDGCLRAGARGYLLKDTQNLNLADRLMEVVQGHAALDPRAAGVLTDLLVHTGRSPKILTGRELEVLRLTAEGLTNKEIGRELGISENTVKGYFKEILVKMDARNRVAAVLKARQRGLL